MDPLLLLYIVILVGIFGAIGQYIDKHLVNKGITRDTSTCQVLTK